MVTLLEQLRSAISLLAASPEDQRLYMIEIGRGTNSLEIDEATNIDELGLQFEDASYLVAQLARKGELNAEAVEHIEDLNNLMLRLSGMKNSDFWTIKALYEDDRWAQVRALARKSLVRMM